MKRLSDAEKQWLKENLDPSGRKRWVQESVLTQWRTLSNSRGTAELATGVGKTRIGILAVAETLTSNPDAEVWIIVPTETLRDIDWPDEFRKWEMEDMLLKVNIICYASVPNMKPRKDIDLLILDEVHHLTPKASAVFSLPGIKVFDVLGLTATLPRTTKSEGDKERRELINQYCPSIYKVSLEDAIQLQLVADFKVSVLKYVLDNTGKYPVMVKGKQWSEATRYAFLTKQLQRAMFDKNDGFKFTAIQQRADFLRNLESKTALATIVMDKVLKGKRTLIFCGSIAQSRKLCGDNRIFNSETNSEALEAFQRGDISYLGVVNALNEGKNVNDLDQILVIQLDSNERNIIQRIGRAVRFRAGHEAHVIVLVANKTADEKWYQSAFKEFDKSRITEYNVTIE